MFRKMMMQLVCICRANSYRLRPRRITWIKIKREDVKSGRSGAHKPSKLGLGDLGVIPTPETSSGNWSVSVHDVVNSVPD